MSCLDMLLNAPFKTDEKGNTIFYPWGSFGKGYILPEDQKEIIRTGIKRINKRIYQIAYPLAILLLLLRIWFPLLIALMAFGAWYMIWLRRITKKLIPSSRSLTFSEGLSNEALPASFRLTKLWLLGIVFFIFGALNIPIIITAPKNRAVAISAMFIFFVLGIYIIWKSIKERKRI